MNAFLALAGHAAHRAGGVRVAWLAAVAGLLAAAAAAQLPVADTADRGLIAAAAGLAVTGAVTGVGLALGAALSLTATPQLAPIAAAPVGRGLLALAALAGVTAATAGAAAAGTAGTLAGTALTAGIRRPMARWEHPAAIEGAAGARGPARWTEQGRDPLRIPLPAGHTGGPLTVRLRPRMRLSAERAGPFSALPPQPVAVAWLRDGLPVGASNPTGSPWSGGKLTVTIEPPPGPVTLLVTATAEGVQVGLTPEEVGVKRRDAALGAVVLRTWAGLLAPLALIALVAACTSAFCSRGVSAAAGLATAMALGLAPTARGALAELGKPEGVEALLRPAAAALLAVIPDPAGGLEALLAGHDLAWGAVWGSAAAHLPWAALLAAGSWWAVRNRDW